MVSIPSISEPVQAQEEQLTKYRYVFRLTPERVKSLTPEQKEQALLEFLTLFTLILSVIYNPKAKEATRLLALDVIVTQVQRASRKLIGTITDKSPTYAAETEKRLGLSKNTISSGYKRLEKAGVIERSHRTDEVTKQDHLDIQPTPILFTEPSVIRDKKKRAAPKPKLAVNPVDPTKQCLSCDSTNLRITCRDCGSFIDLGETKHTCEVEVGTTTTSDTATVVEEEGYLHHKFCEVTEEQRTVTNFVMGEKPPTPPVSSIACAYRAPDPSDMPPAILPMQPMKERPAGEKQEKEQKLEEVAKLLLDIAGNGKDHIEMPGENGKKYKTVHAPLTRRDILTHLTGEKTIGATLQHTDATTRALCFDTDDNPTDPVTWLQFQEEAKFLIAQGYQSILEPSPAGRGGHLWIIFTEHINAQAAHTQVCEITPTLKDCREYWPSSRNQKVRLPAGKYITPTFKASTHLFDAQGNELSMLALLTHQTPASLIPAPSETIESTDVAQKYPRNRDHMSVTKSAEHREADEYHRRKYGKNEMWVEWPSEQYLIDRFNAQHTIDDLATPERNGMINASTIGRPERTASVGITKDGRRFTDFGAGARKKDGTQDGGDAFEFYCRLHNLNKSDALRELGQGLNREASQEILRAARAGELPPSWVMDIITDKGRAVYNENALRHGHNTLEAHEHGGVLGFSKAGGQVQREERLPWERGQEDHEQGIPQDFTTDVPCEQCGCCLYRDMLGSIVCVRCYPPRGYHNYSKLIDAGYPRRKRVEFS